MTLNNESRAAEQQRVDHIEKLITTQLAQTQTKLNQAQQERRRVEKNFGANTRADYVEADDVIDTNATLAQQKQLMASATTNEDILHKQQQSLQLLAQNPYFGRIDIEEDHEPDTLYIGTASLEDDQGNFLIYDWRAPIAGIYYNGTLGSVKYHSPSGLQTVELKRKRQFVIQAGQIINMFDTNETIGDEILQKTLNEASSEQMKNIVATIQQDQNQIIRNTQADILLVQGAAGSGKTSAVMQRIAFLLYHNRTQLTAEEIILFSPNTLFSNYIAAVLPSLGENNMRQVTLQHFLAKRLHGLQVETLFARFEKEQITTSASFQAISKYKASSQFVTDLQTFLQTADLTQSFQDILFEGHPIFKRQHLQNLYQKLPRNLLIADKFLAIKNHLIKQLNHYLKTQRTADWVLSALDNLSESQINTLLYRAQALDASSQQQQQALIKAVIHQRYLPVYEALYNNYFFNVYQLYHDFLTRDVPKSMNSQHWQEMIAAYDHQLEAHRINYEDATAILFLRQQITGEGQNHQIKYLMIDEVQDYTPLQLAYIQHSFPLAKLTLLGDLSQNVYGSPTSLQDTATTLKVLFPQHKKTVITLHQSYRSTANITNFAKQLIPMGQQIRAFNRIGSLPQWYISDDARKTTQQISQQALKQYHTVAIITKTNVQAQALAKSWSAKIPVHLLTEQDRKIPRGIIILPIYLAKGLEFDCVLGYQITAANYATPTDRNILYTLATRALHQLYLVSENPVSPFLQQLDPASFQLQRQLTTKKQP